MKIRISKSSYNQIGCLRVSDHVFKLLEKMSHENKVSKQEIVRAILDEVIDEVEL